MKVHYFKFFKIKASYIVMLFIAYMLPSCASKKDILYFQSDSSAAIENEGILNQGIEVNDILSIKVVSQDFEASRIYNLDMLAQTNMNAGQNTQVLKLTGYLVDYDGSINMPILGNIMATDKTTSELELFLTKKLTIEGHLKEPNVTVRILNAKVTILGEVKSPGTFEFAEKNLTLLQALGLAGDLNINGQRKDVLLIRQDKNVKTINHIDLTTTEWMKSDLFYIKQNDVIVVNPNKAKIKSAGIIGSPGVLISVASFILTGLLLIKN